MAVTTIAEDYTAAAALWSDGPGRIYDVLAERLVATVGPLPAECSALDAGCGEGAATVALLRRGVDVTALDVTAEPERIRRLGVRFVAGDLTLPPFADGTFDLAVAACSLNHVDPPAAGLAALRRVVRPAGTVLASTFALDDDHPAKGAVDAALRAAGWVPPAWYDDVRRGPMRSIGTPDGFHAAATDAGLLDVEVARVEVVFDDLDADALITWRLGMAQCAPFVARLVPAALATVRRRARAALGTPPPLVRALLILRAHR